MTGLVTVVTFILEEFLVWVSLMLFDVVFALESLPFYPGLFSSILWLSSQGI